MSRGDSLVDELVGHRLLEGERVGRFVVVKAIDGQPHPVAAGSVAAVCQTHAGTLLMLPGCKLLADRSRTPSGFPVSRLPHRGYKQARCLFRVDGLGPDLDACRLLQRDRDVAG